MNPNINNKIIIATIGPSCESINLLLQMKRSGVDIFRVNMSHSSIEDLIKFAKIGQENNLRIGLDTEGGQIRTFLNDRNLTNDGRKWYLVKLKFINLEQLNKKNLIKIVLKKGNENANFFSVYNKKKIGEMLFLKK